MKGGAAARRLHADRRGAVSLLGAMAMMFALGCLAFAVDLGSIYFHTRQLQGVADAAALAAADNPAQADGGARAAIRANAWSEPYDLAVSTGNYTADPDIAPAARFADSGSGAPDAARVRIDTTTPLFFGIAALGRGRIGISRTATAARIDMASFTIGSRLAALDGGIANALLGALTGSRVSLSVMDYNALLSADVDLFGTLDALRTRLRLQAGSYDDVLTASMTSSDVLQALATTLAQGGSTAAAQAVRQVIASAARSGAVSLDRLIDLGALGAQDRVTAGQRLQINAFDLLRTTLEAANGTRQVQLDLGATIPGLTSVTAKLAVGDRPVSSPWLTVTNKHVPVVRTAQTRLYLEANVAPAGNLLGIASVRLPLYVELAAAQATLSSISCRTGSGVQGVSLSVRPSIGHAAIADLSGDMTNHSVALTESGARLVTLPLIAVTGQARVDFTGDGWQNVAFDAGEVAAHQVKTVSSTTLAQGLAASLVSRMNLSATVAGLGIGVPGVTALVGNALAPAAPALDGVLNALTGLLGLHLGQADVRIIGVRCGVPTLVA